jgi:hypothetical protein
MITFVEKTFVKEVTYDGTTLEQVQFNAKIIDPETETPDTIATTSKQTVVYDVHDLGTNLWEYKIELTVWDIAEAAGNTIVSIEECEE